MFIFLVERGISVFEPDLWVIPGGLKKPIQTYLFIKMEYKLQIPALIQINGNTKNTDYINLIENLPQILNLEKFKMWKQF